MRMARERRVVLIGGTGVGERLSGAKDTIETQFGRIPVLISEITGRRGKVVLFGVSRHGENGKLLPHDVNYRGNVSVAKAVGADAIIATAACGIAPANLPMRGYPSRALLLRSPYKPKDLILAEDLFAPNIVLGGQPPTFSTERRADGTNFTPMNEVYSLRLRRHFLEAATQAGVKLKNGIYVIYSIGDRYETPLEVKVYSQVDEPFAYTMTGIEGIFAKEVGVPYLLIVIGTNWAAGVVRKHPTDSEVQRMVALKANEITRLTIKALEIW
jgi:purine nucleoside phosphorylase